MIGLYLEYLKKGKEERLGAKLAFVLSLWVLVICLGMVTAFGNACTHHGNVSPKPSTVVVK